MEQPGQRDAGVVDEHVDRTEPRSAAREERVDRLGSAHVERVRERRAARVGDELRGLVELIRRGGRRARPTSRVRRARPRSRARCPADAPVTTATARVGRRVSQSTHRR